jgi:hypothetical protein
MPNPFQKIVVVSLAGVAGTAGRIRGGGVVDFSGTLS